VVSPAVLRVVVDAAHEAGRPVVVHAEGSGTVRTALEAGADRLAHTPWTERLDPGLLRACARRTTWISTLDIHGWGAPTATQSGHRATAMHNLRGLLEAGGVVRYGTDLGNGPLPLGVNRREVEALLEVGLTPEGVLAAMTGPGGAQLGAGLPPCLVPGGLEVGTSAFAAALATARVVVPEPPLRTA
jgi:imidazolonepropionase-like amidohydrolase